MKFLKSFYYAAAGILYGINHERNMRVHIVVAAFVIVFSLFFPMSGAEYAVLLLLIGAVFSLELINTALERAGDAITTQRKAEIKVLKDVAAGAVLVMALAAAAIAVFLFWKPEGFCAIFRTFGNIPILFLPLGAGIVFSVFFIWKSPLELYNKLRKNRNDQR